MFPTYADTYNIRNLIMFSKMFNMFNMKLDYKELSKHAHGHWLSYI